MINFNFSLENPFSNKFENVFCKNFNVTENKNIEVECYNSATIIQLEFSITTRCDHAGFDFRLGFLGYTIGISMLDGRHWLSEKDRYQEYGDLYDIKGKDV